MTFELRRAAVLEAIDHELESTPVVLLSAPRGGGKSVLLKRLFEERRDRGDRCALLQCEPISCSPEVLDSELRRLASPLFARSSGGAPSFDSLLRALRQRSKDSILFLDDVTEIRTLSYYPGVEEPLAGFLAALESAGRAVLTSRFSYWTQRSFPELPMLRIPRISASELAEVSAPEPELVAAASGGIVVHAVRLAEALQEHGGSLRSALLSEMSPGGRVEAECRASFAELLHRARGYGACKTVLRVLSQEQGLKLAEVARRIDRTAGSTRDYLRWLEEVDLIFSREKRYSYVDPLLRLWTRVYARGVPAEKEDIAAEVESYVEGLAPQRAEKEETPQFILPEPSREDFVEID
ncbi:MAG: hypothetical protein ACRD21_22695 [Vicinamibacteria bacterium]